MKLQIIIIVVILINKILSVSHLVCNILFLEVVYKFGKVSVSKPCGKYNPKKCPMTSLWRHHYYIIPYYLIAIN